LIELEHEKLGVSHQDLGAYLLNLWDLPFAYVEVAMFHHRPMDHRIINRELVAVVHLAHYYSAIYLHDNDGIKLDTKVFALLKLDDQCVERMIKGELGWRLYD
jgi:HD-like signal output (HDOD) protein